VRNIARFTLCQQPIKFDPADDVLLTGSRRKSACEFWLVTPQKLHWAAVRLRDRLAAAFRRQASIRMSICGRRHGCRASNLSAS
jgi:hypothetical protein